MRVYLAGPDVFFPDAAARLAAMRTVCAQHGLIAATPLDGLDGIADPFAIARQNEAHIRDSQAVIANLTPFRGPGVDPGTAYEVGFARALGLPVFGWTTVAGAYAARVPPDGLLVEDFGLCDNLMIACAAVLIEAGQGAYITVFTRLVARVAQWAGALAAVSPPSPH